MFELGEAPRPLGQIVHEERRPLRADDLCRRRYSAGRRLVHWVHGAHGHNRIVLAAYGRNGCGVASILGIENRAIVPKPPGAGLHACATPASQATERKMNASSMENSHSST